METLRLVSRYHTNDSGKTLPCTAGIRECKFVHGSSPAEAAHNWQQSMGNQLLPAGASKLVNMRRLEELRGTSLKRMDDRQLTEAIILESDALGFDTAKISEAIALAGALHGKQFRKGRRGDVEKPPYIEHPLRNALRAIRLGCRKQTTVNGCTLHDTVEDGSSVFAKSRGWSNRQAADEHAARELLVGHLNSSFGTETTRIVLGATNEIAPPSSREMSISEKHAVYVSHVREQVLKDPEVFIVKYVDFVDNATGLFHNVGSMDPLKLRNQATKYLLTVPVYQEGLDTLDLDLPAHSKHILQLNLIETERRLRKIVGGWDGSGRI